MFELRVGGLSSDPAVRNLEPSQGLEQFAEGALFRWWVPTEHCVVPIPA
jgi:hypothetical protein